MKIKVADHIGFCFGVRRAVNIAQDALAAGDRFFCVGPLIHSPQEVKRLSDKGLTIVSDIKVLRKGDTLIIRSHGLLPALIDAAKRRGVRLVDATCPFVKNAQDICRGLRKEGFDVVVIGDKEHPEVKALVGFAGGEAVVVENLEDLRRLKSTSGKIGILAQTTQSRHNFHELVNAILKRYNSQAGFSQIRIFNTICQDSTTRQANALRISSVCDVMLVIGGRNSANSKRLANICRQNVSRTHHIEVADDIRPSWVGNGDLIGVVSGASTPDWIIKDVICRLKDLRSNKKSLKRRRKQV